MQNNELVNLLHIQHPIIQAPMAGGITTTKLVTAVSAEGGLGMIGAGYMNTDELKSQIKEVKLTTTAFGVNLFVPEEFTITKEEIVAADQTLSSIREKLTVTEKPKLPTQEKTLKTFEDQLNIILEQEVPVCSFTFGLPGEKVVKELKKNGTILIGTATTVREAIEVERLGMDAVVVQGSEAGGHRGNFLNNHSENSIGLMSLIPQVVDSVMIPVIAAGGIMDGRGLAAAFCLGAKGVQMGTAFLTTKESGANDIHKQEILKTTEEDIVVTRIFSGKRAQGIHNKFITEMKGQEENLPPFPVMNSFTQPIRKAAAVKKEKEYMSLWSGQSPRLAKEQSVKELMNHVISEANKRVK